MREVRGLCFEELAFARFRCHEFETQAGEMSTDLIVPEALYNVVVNHTDSLHESVADG